jgi:hypothetical protein
VAQAFDTVFGANHWLSANASTSATSIFNASNRFVFMEGGYHAWGSLLSYYGAHSSMIDAWVRGGGSLIIEGAPTSGGNLTTTFGASILFDPGLAYKSNNETPTNPASPIFSGPYGIVPSLFGQYAAHSQVVSDGSFTKLAIGDGGLVGLAEKNVGAGHVILSGLTTPLFADDWVAWPNWIPFADNLVAYGSGRSAAQATPEPSTFLAAAVFSAIAIRRGKRRG